MHLNARLIKAFKIPFSCKKLQAKGFIGHMRYRRIVVSIAFDSWHRALMKPCEHIGPLSHQAIGLVQTWIVAIGLE